MVLPKMRLVSLTHVLPHEEPHQDYVDSIAARLHQSQTMYNTPVALELPDGGEYLLLDGTHRVAALRRLGYTHVPIQIVTAGEATIMTWTHVVRELDWLSEICSHNDFVWHDHPPVGTSVRIEIPERVGYLSAVEPATGAGMALLFRTVGFAYRDYDRVVDPPACLGTGSCVVSFSQSRLTTIDLERIARSGQLWPCGITRVLCEGRVLNVNVPLRFCYGDNDSSWNDFILGKVAKLRLYRESILNCE